MSQSRSRIALQLAIALSLILVLLISVSTLIALKSLSSASLTTREQHLGSEARLMAEQLSTFHNSLRISTSRLAGLFERRFSGGLSLDTQQRLPLASRSAPALSLQGSALNGQFELVDEFHKLTDGVATVFVRDGADFVRISTSLLKEDGSRAIATELDRNHPAYERLLRGEQYVGRAELFGRLYMTQYVPVRDTAGQVIAVLFVGFDYTDDQQAQIDRLKQFRIGTGGSLALLDEQGRWLLAPYGVVADSELGERLQRQLQAGKGLRWGYGDEAFYSVSAPFAEGPWQVVATLSQDEINVVTWRVGGQMALGSLLSMLIAVFAVLWLLRRRLRPLGDLVAQARAFGAGDLGARTQVQSNDEIGELGRSFNQMGDALSGMVEQIRLAAGQVHGRSQQLSALAAGAQNSMEHQSGEISSMAGAVEEFSATAQDIADSMRTTERLSSDNVQQTQQGSLAMKEASAALTQISQALDGTAATINLLGQRSQEIGGIVGVITSIAEQTNLLALNAAIEAARAGEQGRGFAVVADEVRNLASRTREATDEISAMITSIQEQTASAMVTMRQGQALMGEGIERNGKVAEALSQVLEKTHQAGEQFAAITTATQEQSSTATMLSGNLQAIAQVNEDQRHTVADLASTAGELDALASGLQREVSRFH